MIVIIGNHGSFSLGFVNFIRDTLTDKVMYLPISHGSDSFRAQLDKLCLEYDELKKIEAVYYLGGETRNEKYMSMYNFEIPKEIYAKFRNKAKKFIYLSSLAALDKHKFGVITENDSSNIDHQSEYSKSKSKFDKWVWMQSSKDMSLSTIYPASIIGVTHRGSSLQKIYKFYKRFEWLGFIKFRSTISFCSREEVYSALSDMLMSTTGRKHIVANNALLNDVFVALSDKKIKCFIPLPLNVRVISTIGRFMPHKVSKVLLSVFNTAVYKNTTEPLRILGSQQIRDYILKYKVSFK